MNTKIIPSVCTYCGVGCEIEAHIIKGEINSIQPLKEGKVNRGKLCIKGKEGYTFLYAKEKLKDVLIKKEFLKKNSALFSDIAKKELFLEADEKYLKTDYETGAKIVAKKLLELKEKFGSESIMGIGGARTNCESAYLFQKFIRNAIGSPHIDNCARVCHSPSLNGLKYGLGEGASPNPFDDIFKAEFIMVIGSNTTEAHPIVANRILDATKEGASLCVIDVREIQLGKKANFQVVLPPEANLLFLNCMARVILEENLYNKNFITSRVSWFKEYKNAILSDPYSDPNIFKRLKGYEHIAMQVRECARIYALSKSLILWGLGVSEHIDGSYTVSALANLALITGNIGKEGQGLIPLRGQNNVQGACDVGCMPNYLPDYETPKIEGLKTVEAYKEIEDGNLKAIINLGEDLFHIHGNQNLLQKAFNKLEMLVVLEVMESEIGKEADVVFGVRSQYEKKGVYVNAERRLHLSHPLVKSDNLDDWEVLNLLLKYIDCDFGYSNQEELWDEVRSVMSRYRGASYEKLENNHSGLQWPVGESGTVRLYEERFHTEDGAGRLRFKSFKPRGFVKALLEQKEPKLTLVTGRILSQYNNSTQSNKSKRLLEHCSEDILELSHEDAKHLDHTKTVILKSAYGESGALRFKESKKLKKGVCFTTFHFAKSKINFLFGEEGDELTKTTRFKAVEVELLQL